MAQPSDLLNPIPNPGPEEISVDIQRAPAAAQAPAQAPAQQQTPVDQGLGLDDLIASQQQVQSPQGDQTPDAGPMGLDDLINYAEISGKLPSRFTPNAQEVGAATEGGQGASVANLAYLGQARTPQETALMAENLFGKGNVKTLGKKVYFRHNANERLRPLTTKDVGLIQFVAGKFAEQSGVATEIAGSIPAEVAGAALAGPVGAIAGSALGAGMGSLAREGIVSRELGDRRSLSDVSVPEEVGMAMGIGAISRAGGEAIGKIHRAIRDYSPISRLKKVANIRAALDEFKTQIVPEYYGPAHMTQATPSAYKDIAQRERILLGQQVGAVRGELIERSRGQKFQLANTEQTLREMLSEYEGRGVSFDDDGKVKLFEEQLTALGSKAKRMMSEYNFPKEVMSELRDTVAGETVSIKPLAPIGVQGGESVMNKIANMYNDLIDRKRLGGVPASDVLDLTREIEDMAKYDMEVAKSNIFPWRKATTSAIEDRDVLARSVLDPEAYQRYSTSYEDFHRKINEVKEFEKAIQKSIKTGGGKDLVDSIVEPNNPARIRDLEMIGGKDAVDAVKGAWVNQLMSEAVDPHSGHFNSASFINKLKSYGPELVGDSKKDGMLISREQYRQLIHLSNQAKTVDLFDLQRKKGFVQRFVEAPYIMMAGSAKYAGYTLAQILKPNPLNEKLIFDVVDDLIQKAPKQQVQRLLDMQTGVLESWRMRMLKSAGSQTAGKAAKENINSTRVPK